MSINSFIKNMSPDTDIMVLGDSVRYEFLKWFITGLSELPFWENLPVTIHYANNEKSIIKKNKDYWWLTSNFVIPNTNISILQDLEKIRRNEEAKAIFKNYPSEFYNFDGVFLVLAEVFKPLSNTVEKAYKLLKKINKNVKLCFIDTGRKYASTDIDKEISIIEEIVKKYTLEDSDYIVLKNKNDLCKIFSNYESSLSRLKRYGLSKINIINDLFEELKEYLKFEIEDYSFDIISPDFLNSITSFESIIKCNKSKYIVESYIEVSCEKFFDMDNKESFKSIINIFKTFWDKQEFNAFVFWNKEDDLIYFKNNFKDFFIKKADEFIKNNKISKIVKPSSEPDYLCILAGENNSSLHGINIKFHEFIKSFIEVEIQKFVENKIEEKINIIKEFLK